jgi:hypothetical protein
MQGWMVVEMSGGGVVRVATHAGGVEDVVGLA